MSDNSTTPGETHDAPRSHDVVAVGSAIVDVLAHCDDSFLHAQHLTKGSMALIESEADAEVLYAAMGPGIEVSGGSAANTAAGVASFGGRAGFIGRVKDDQLGKVFAHDIRSAGVDFQSPPAGDGPSSARCLILVTRDGERTLSTYLGSAGLIGPDDIDVDLVAGAAVLFGEGYLCDVPAAKEALTKAMDIARAHGRKVAFTLSDSFCVDRHRQEFLELVEGPIDILFANEAEICSLYQVDDFDEALARVRPHCEIVCLTRSEKGSVIAARDDVHVIAAHPVEALVDTTGAGDLYAAGVLYGYTNGLDLPAAGRLASAAAAEVIGHLGARPERPLTDLLDP